MSVAIVFVSSELVKARLWIFDPTLSRSQFSLKENGTILLLDGETGYQQASLQVDGQIQASPAVYNDMMVIGTTGKGTEFVYGIRIR